jgi:serine/threonine protein kinase
MVALSTSSAGAAKPRSSCSERLVSHSEASVYQPGMVLADKYRLCEQLGEGGMGAIWTAEHLALHVEVAVKLIHPALAGTTAGDRFLLEAHASALLQHRFIVKVHDFGFSDLGDPFFVMERLRGESLFDMLCREGALPQIYAAQLILPIIEAIVAAHAHGIVHRDLKPENIMIVTDDAGCLLPKVLDFGVAKVVGTPFDSPWLSQGDTIVGTPDYMSPEQARGESDVDERADVWGLSMILFEMLMGERPFKGSNYHSVLMSIIGDPRPPLRGVDRALASIVSRGLEKDRSRRWASAHELGVALAGWLTRRSTFEDITTASIRARWGLNSSRPPSNRPVTQPVQIPPPPAVPAVPRRIAAGFLGRPSSQKRRNSEHGSRIAHVIQLVGHHVSTGISRRGLVILASGLMLLAFATLLGRATARIPMRSTSAQVLLPVLEAGKSLQQRMLQSKVQPNAQKFALSEIVEAGIGERDSPPATPRQPRRHRPKAKHKGSQVAERRRPVSSTATGNATPTARPARDRVDFGF